MKNILESIRERHQMPALAAAIIQAGNVVELGAVGQRRIGSTERVTEGDLWHIGSCTKAMTATVIAVLVEEQALTWHTTIGHSFPALRGKIHSDWHGVTMEQLLAHRSGLPCDREPDIDIFPKVCALAGPIRQQRLQLVRLVLSRPPVQRPGSAIQYWICTAGFGASGTDGDLTQPRGHRNGAPVEPGVLADNPAVIGPAGTVHCALEDWSRFTSLHVAGAREESTFLSAVTFRKLHTPVDRDGYALGWCVEEPNQESGPALSFAGTNGMWMAVVWLSPARNLSCLVAVNAGGEVAMNACQDTVNALVPGS